MFFSLDEEMIEKRSHSRMSNGEYFRTKYNNPSHFLSFLVAKVRIVESESLLEQT